MPYLGEPASKRADSAVPIMRAISSRTCSSGGSAVNARYLSARTQAVIDQLIRRNNLPAQQLFVVAHGPNHPIGDNQSAAGRADNRRIEIVIYPETF